MTTVLKKENRIESLDWLRGFAALSIMLYHLSDFTVTKAAPLDASSALGRLGIYGVSIFFILSGLSMAVVYNTYIKDVPASVNFFIRRIFRIWPLLWLVCFLKIIYSAYIIGNAHYGFAVIFLNYTTLFGFVKPTAYIALGAWSIGNEMVYYALTPVILYIYNRNRRAGNTFFLFALMTGLAFAFYFLRPDVPLGRQWAVYVNPFNNLFLYMMGIMIYYNFKDRRFDQRLNWLILFISVILFCLLPFSGDQIAIVTGTGRICFVVLSFLIVLSFYKMEFSFTSSLTKPLSLLGAATYGVYLIHPVIYNYFTLLVKDASIALVFISVIVITISVSILSYKFFEKRLINIGKRITFESVKEKVFSASGA